MTGQEWVEHVAAWGVPARVVHEAPPDWPPVQRREAPSDPPRVVYVCTFSPDEPIAPVLEAARLLPWVSFLVTGDLSIRPPEWDDLVPNNVTAVGYLDACSYIALVNEADVVLTLSYEPTSVMLSAYEAVYAQRVLVIPDWPNLRRLFPHAIHVAIDARSIASGVEHAIRDYGQLLETLKLAREAQLSRWHQQLAAVEKLLAEAGS